MQTRFSLTTYCVKNSTQECGWAVGECTDADCEVRKDLDRVCDEANYWLEIEDNVRKFLCNSPTTGEPITAEEIASELGIEIEAARMTLRNIQLQDAEHAG